MSRSALGTQSTKSGIRLGPKSLKTGKVRHSSTKQKKPTTGHTVPCTKTKRLISSVLLWQLFTTPRMERKRTFLPMLEAMEHTGLSRRQPSLYRPGVDSVSGQILPRRKPLLKLTLPRSSTSCTNLLTTVLLSKLNPNKKKRPRQIQKLVRQPETVLDQMQ